MTYISTAWSHIKYIPNMYRPTEIYSKIAWPQMKYIPNVCGPTAIYSQIVWSHMKYMPHMHIMYAAHCVFLLSGGEPGCHQFSR